MSNSILGSCFGTIVIYLGVSGIIQTNIRNGIGSTDPANDNLDQSSQNPRM